METSGGQPRPGAPGESLQAILERLFRESAREGTDQWSDLARSLHDVLPDTARALSRVDDDVARVLRAVLRHAAVATDTLRAEVGRRSAAPGSASRVARALQAVADVASGPREIFRAAPELACQLAFDRAMYSSLVSGDWVTRSVHIAEDRDWAEHVRFAGQTPQRVEPLLENDLMRGRATLLVRGVQQESRVHQPIAAASECRSYVAAPVLVRGQIVGVVHADHYFNAVDPTVEDRDELLAFTSGLGLAIDRAHAVEKVEATERALGAVVDGLRTFTVDLGSGPVRPQAEKGHVPETPPRERDHLESLTRREREVLQLMAEGWTNGSIAQHLVIAESTVKRHVKNIMRKLGAVNRVAAVKQWLASG